MNDFKILVDSAANLTPELLNEYDLDYVSMTVLVGEKEYEATLGWRDITPTELYNQMRKGVVPHTSQINETTYVKKFEEYLSKGMDVLYIACTSGLSSSINSSFLAKEELTQKYPNQRLEIVDSLVPGMSHGLLGMRASNLKNDGKTLDEVIGVIEQEKLHYHQFGTVNDLNFLKRGGRVKASAAFFGNLIGVKPILTGDTKGSNVALCKVKGRKTSIEKIAELVASHMEDPENHYISIIHADCMEDALTLKEKILEKVPNTKGVLINEVGWIVGATSGPSTLNVYHYGTKIIDEV